MGRVAEVVSATLWYRKEEGNQYDSKEIATYDAAARNITQRENFAKELIQQVGDLDGRTLEIGAGTGLISQEIDRHSSDAVYVDREDAALNLLRQRLLGRAVVLQADFFNLPLDDNTIDNVIGVGVYRYVPPERSKDFWDEMHRIIKPDGRAIIAQFYARFVSVRGNDIRDDIASIDPYFSLTNTSQWNSAVNLGPLRIKTGTYRTFEFTHK